MRKMQNFFENKIVKREFKKFCTIYFGLVLVRCVAFEDSLPFSCTPPALFKKGKHDEEITITIVNAGLVGWRMF